MWVSEVRLSGMMTAPNKIAEKKQNNYTGFTELIVAPFGFVIYLSVLR